VEPKTHRVGAGVRLDSRVHLIPPLSSLIHCSAVPRWLRRRRRSGRRARTIDVATTPGPTEVTLGAAPVTEERVSRRLSINSNPHLMIVGLPGMGKTTCLANLCWQLHAAGINLSCFPIMRTLTRRSRPGAVDLIRLITRARVAAAHENVHDFMPL
jgi:hypothetical protein